MKYDFHLIDLALCFHVWEPEQLKIGRPKKNIGYTNNKLIFCVYTSSDKWITKLQDQIIKRLYGLYLMGLHLSEYSCSNPS